ncbi:transposase zinc-binding domain-containing protein [Halobacillus shinanisalinarum]|uniref:transposase zinc-binding domain-containing protein n=1 Tax=Halobacillus shinanisalinarum TaxID=2932258 RepID=UPI0037BEF728
MRIGFLKNKETVEETIHCGTKNIGYARYECLGCEGNPAPRFVCFTCKSRFCHTVGKNIRMNGLKTTRIVPHCHMVFNTPKKLRKVFYEDRKKLNALSKQVAEVFQYHNYSKSKKQGLQSGITTVIYIFGILYHYMEKRVRKEMEETWVCLTEKNWIKRIKVRRVG